MRFGVKVTFLVILSNFFIVGVREFDFLSIKCEKSVKTSDFGVCEVERKILNMEMIYLRKINTHFVSFDHERGKLLRFWRIFEFFQLFSQKI